mgnify:CR=1 FL=1
MTAPLSLYDTTLRDGQQTQGVQFSAAEKAEIALMLDSLGVDYIEGGWPGANPTDSDFFAAARLNPHATLITGVICGVKVQEIDDPLMRKIRYLDKLVDELAKGKAIEKVLR